MKTGFLKNIPQRCAFRRHAAHGYARHAGRRRGRRGGECAEPDLAGSRHHPVGQRGYGSRVGSERHRRGTAGPPSTPSIRSIWTQQEAGYNLGAIEHPEFDGGGFSSWADMVNIQFVGGDNQGNPWGQANRNWACIIAPFPGMAFSVKGEVVQAFTNPKTAISNQFEWTDPRTGVAQYWQMFDDGEYFINTDGSGAVNNGWGYAPGSTCPVRLWMLWSAPTPITLTMRISSSV